MPQLSMPLYVSSDDVIERMQLQGQLAGVVALVQSAIIGAQLHVQSCIGSELVEVERNDLFFCDDDAFSGIKPGGMFRLELASGFVRSDEDFTVNFGRDWQLSDSQTAPLGTFTVDYERGYLYMDACQYKNKYVQVLYTSGFSASVGTPALPTVPSPNYSTTPAPYSDQKLYEPGDVAQVQTPVSQAIELWLCIVETQGNQPPNSLYWQQIVQVPVTPVAYDNTVVYTENAVVTYQGNTFICTNPSGVAGTLPTVVTNWTQVVFAPQQIPADLYEGIMSDLPGVLNADESTNRSDQAQKMYKTLSDHTQMLLKKYFRLKGFSHRPVMST